jgi:hypothetical protein
MTATNAKPSNQRRHVRIHLKHPVSALDLMTGRGVGEVVNITTEGLMLVMEEALESGGIYQLALTLPEPLNGESVINLGAECLWSSEASVAKRYWAGFQIIDLSIEAENMIKALIQEYGIK